MTHVNDGFDFLGFHIRRFVRPHGGKPVVLVKPSKKNMQRLKAKVRDMTGRHRLVDNEVLKMAALNRVLRGWIGYYRHANVKQVADSLDFWVEWRMAPGWAPNIRAAFDASYGCTNIGRAAERTSPSETREGIGCSCTTCRTFR